jgi:hypothetical protein
MHVVNAVVHDCSGDVLSSVAKGPCLLYVEVKSRLAVWLSVVFLKTFHLFCYSSRPQSESECLPDTTDMDTGGPLETVQPWSLVVPGGGFQAVCSLVWGACSPPFVPRTWSIMSIIHFYLYIYVTGNVRIGKCAKVVNRPQSFVILWILNHNCYFVVLKSSNCGLKCGL